jgi:hypothetical protein
MPLPERIQRVATATLREYARGLRAAFGVTMPGEADRQADYVLEWQGARAELALAPLEDFEIGGLRLERLSFDLRFAGGEEPARKALLDRLDRYQQRGGG